MHESSFFSSLSRKAIIDPNLILQTYHKNCMYKATVDLTEKAFNEVSIQCPNSLDNNYIDEQTQVSRSNESKESQTSDVNSPISIRNQQQSETQHVKVKLKKYVLINPYAMIDRADQGEQFLKFLYEQNAELITVYTSFLKHLLRYTDQFLLSLQQKHGLYGVYRQDMMRYVISLQEQISELRAKVNILREANKTLASFRKHFYKITRSKCELENALNKYQKRSSDHSQSGKYQEQLLEVYQRTSIQLRTVEEQRLVAIREQIRFAMNLTITSLDRHSLFTSNNVDDLLDGWDNQHKIAIDHWSHLPAYASISQQYSSLLLLDEIKQIVDKYYNQQQLNSSHRNTQMITFLNESTS
ncbi:unnamed protein product [Adineta ricciae]|uniref:Uncharacterized protein n=2 Tax=Adineta ricciae TaxID=249248 RepID=A0A814TM95_ADIRI|nr:unnamed protein product [Adineta ricciae]CAF1163260.1 unnamed protein product [Adineta ricciae]